ncbi:MAG: metallophosphoesterase [Bacteroidota bacterium]
MMLEIGYNHSFEVRREQYHSPCSDNFSVLYISDLHLNGFCNNLVTRIGEAIIALNPTIILLGGDYVDSRKGLGHLNDLLSMISGRDHVFAIAGNHDYFFGIDAIKAVMTEHHVAWIENKSTHFMYNNTSIRIDGTSIGDAASDAGFSILVLHKPISIDRFHSRYNLAFAGHLHGCQFVFWQSENKLYPGRFFYKWNILETQHNSCKYYISKGMGDTLPVRYNCKRDLLFIEVQSTI